jgi:hypothetical protein
MKCGLDDVSWQTRQVEFVTHLSVSSSESYRNPLQKTQTHNERGVYPSPVSSHSIDLPNSRLIESKTSAPASFRPSSIADR